MSIRSILSKKRKIRIWSYHITFNLKEVGVSLISLIFLFTGFFIFWVASLPLPEISSFSDRRVEESTKIYDRTGEVVLFDFVDKKRRHYIPLPEISHHLKNATIAIEDSSFYSHKGVRPLSFFRAALVNLTSLEFSQGGSTITQQLVKNSLLTSDKKITRKVKEILISYKIEEEFEKEEILEFYLNEIPYGGNVYGIGEASEVFFEKSATELTLAESAYLASLPKAPSRYSPYGENKDELEDRKNTVLRRMFDLSIITEMEYEDAKNENVIFNPQVSNSIKAPHFVFHVQNEIENLKNTLPRDISGGVSVTTTLDYELQKTLQEIATRYAFTNKEKFNAENVGLIAIDTRTGEILAMVGSRGYFDEEIDGKFNVTIAERQPGSVFKPFAYAAAFDSGYTPDTVLFDVPTQFHESCDPNNFTSEDECYAPVNYDGEFRGPVTMRNALAQSINIPSVKTLYLAGINETFKLANAMGITTLTDPLRYGLTLVLGGGEVRLLDVVNAYATFGRGGIYIPHSPIRSIQKGDSTLYTPQPQKSQVLKSDVARNINDILSDNIARTPAFGIHSALRFDEYDVGVKTGTTNDFRDAWIIGYSADIAVGAWAGNNDNSPMEKKVAGFIVAPLWREAMNAALEVYGERKNRFIPPQEYTGGKQILKGVWYGNESYEVDSISGGLATEYTPDETRVNIPIYDPHTILHWVNRKDPRGNVPRNPNQTPQYERWEYGVERWVEENISSTNFVQEKPDFIDPLHTEFSKPDIVIESPRAGGIFDYQTPLTIRVNAIGRYDIQSYEYYINGNIIEVSERGTYTITPKDVSEFKRGKNTIRVVVKDEVHNTSTREIEITIR